MDFKTIWFKISSSLLFCSIPIIPLNVIGQNIASTTESDLLRAKAYQISAIEQYNNGNYDRALEYCVEIEKFLGPAIPEVEAIRVKSYFAVGDFSKAKISMDLFLRIVEDNELTEQMLPYIVYIDDEIREEKQLFENAKNLKSVEEYSIYLKKYPNGRYQQEVNRLLKEQQEEDDWLTAKNLGTIDGFKDYIAAYPGGKHVTKANENIASLDYEFYTEAITENTQKSLNHYLNTYSEGTYRSEVEVKLEKRIEYDIYIQAKKTDNLEDYIAYVDEYPKNTLLMSMSK